MLSVRRPKDDNIVRMLYIALRYPQVFGRCVLDFFVLYVEDPFNSANGGDAIYAAKITRRFRFPLLLQGG